MGTATAWRVCDWTNIELKDVIGEILQDENIRVSTVRWKSVWRAYGSAVVFVDALDVVGRKFDIWVDGEQIMRAGQFLIEA